MALDLVPLWTLLLGLSVFYYVIFDGFDLGVGILYGLMPDPADRGTAMSSIAPIWDGNETWLVFGGLGLLAAFPLAFAIIIPAVYFPILIMLLALVFRGVAFEFRFTHPGARRFWDRAFCGGSALATFAQGTVLGSFIQGFTVNGRQFAGSSFDWVTPFALATGVALMFGYALLGAGWLILKTEGALQEWARRAGRVCLVGVLAAIAGVSIWTPIAEPGIAARWFSWPNIAYLSPVPVLTAVLGAVEWAALARRSELVPFLGAIGLFLLSFLGIAISLWPMIVPPHYTLWQAASSESTQAFLLIGTLFLLPVILMYTAWSYWVFRGKVRGEHF
ncbi:MAG TPA: cytochrome d ubiquinol oxidase subunit II [Stellaceae bacterium]|jgi:cytochrome d ubiquinol oxidase subunit II|nr:cytochrome d ubiquinol oxidase subunit II [Stellaceae bacterium]